MLAPYPLPAPHRQQEEEGRQHQQPHGGSRQQLSRRPSATPCQRDMRRLGPCAAAELNHRLQGQPGPVLPPGLQSQRIAPG